MPPLRQKESQQGTRLAAERRKLEEGCLAGCRTASAQKREMAHSTEIRASDITEHTPAQNLGSCPMNTGHAVRAIHRQRCLGRPWKAKSRSLPWRGCRGINCQGSPPTKSSTGPECAYQHTSFLEKPGLGRRSLLTTTKGHTTGNLIQGFLRLGCPRPGSLHDQREEVNARGSTFSRSVQMLALDLSVGHGGGSCTTNPDAE